MKRVILRPVFFAKQFSKLLFQFSRGNGINQLSLFGKRDRSLFFRNHEADRVCFLRKTEGGTVARPQTVFDLYFFAERKDGAAMAHAPSANQDAAIVSRRVFCEK